MRYLGISVRYFVRLTSMWAAELAGHEANIMYHRENHVVPLFSLIILNATTSKAVSQSMCLEISNSKCFHTH
jgi:hypothetical protein